MLPLNEAGAGDEPVLLAPRILSLYGTGERTFSMKFPPERPPFDAERKPIIYPTLNLILPP